MGAPDLTRSIAWEIFSRINRFLIVCFAVSMEANAGVPELIRPAIVLENLAALMSRWSGPTSLIRNFLRSQRRRIDFDFKAYLTPKKLARPSAIRTNQRAFRKPDMAMTAFVRGGKS